MYFFICSYVSRKLKKNLFLLKLLALIVQRPNEVRPQITKIKEKGIPESKENCLVAFDGEMAN